MNKLVVLVAGVVFAMAGPATAELIENGDFEDGLNDWSHWGSGSGSGSWGYAWLSGYADVGPSGGSDGGQYALLDTYFLDPVGYMSNWGWVYLGVWSAEDEPMTTGDPITFRGKAIDLLDDGVPDTVSVNVEYFNDVDLDGHGSHEERVDLDGNGIYEGEFDRTIFDFPLTSEGNWEEFGASMTVPESLGQTIELVRLFWYIGGTGIAGVDELSFVMDEGFEADFDGDGDVDGDDFLRWQGGFGTSSGAMKSDGDYDNDFDVDGDDFLGWQDEFGSGSGAASAVVPEPASILLLIAALVGCVFVKRRN